MILMKILESILIKYISETLIQRSLNHIIKKYTNR